LNDDTRHSRRQFIATSLGATASLAVSPTPAVGFADRANETDLGRLSLKKAADLLRRKAVSPVELTQACLKRIERYNAALNAFITVTPEQALVAARELENEQQRGAWRGALHGIPIALKDNIDTAGVRTTGASELFKDRVPSDDAEVARRLKQAGAILLGKLNLHEFAYGGTSTVTYFGTMHNPWDLDHVTGGSSGGPGIAVSADLCYGSLGTDTAGSIRMPASHCGIVGLKPTYGRVSTRGVMTLSWTLDHVGPMCKTVEDAAVLLNVIAGFDVLDPTTPDVPVPDYARALKASTTKLRLGVPRSRFSTTSIQTWPRRWTPRSTCFAGSPPRRRMWSFHRFQSARPQSGLQKRTSTMRNGSPNLPRSINRARARRSSVVLKRRLPSTSRLVVRSRSCGGKSVRCFRKWTC
jgi:aspartyl-tRNA(Asn)/glutamyl-tRNA(Gln) amidotransferase subunit A